MLLKLKEKNEKNLEKKKKNAEMVEQRRQKILDKYLETEQRIKKQKDENSKELFNKYLTIAMKREDTMNNLERFERMQEFEREKKINKILNREKRLNDLQKKKNEINVKKKDLNMKLFNRKKELIGKANSILLSGDYDNVNEIFKKVFNEEELNEIYMNNPNDINDSREEIKGNKSAFFTTQSHA